MEREEPSRRESLVLCYSILTTPSSGSQASLAILAFGADVLEGSAHHFDVLSVVLGVTIVEEEPVAIVHGFHAQRMFDRAPILFCAGSNLRGTGQHSVGIAAIVAVELFGPIQVSQMASIQQNEITVFHFRNAIDGETDGLIYDHYKIEEGNGNHACPDDRRGEQNPGARIPDVACELRHELLVSGAGLIGKADLALPHFVKEFHLLLLQLAQNLLLKCAHPLQQGFEGVVHGGRGEC